MQLPMIPFLLSWTILPALKKPFEGNLNAGYLAQSGNTKSSSLTADTTMTWYGQTTAWSLWGNASNTSSNDERSSEKYAAGGRSRFNLN
ncbi:putative outer membrane protein, acid-inducible [Escherichia coli]|nr:putative outer membrane protein, acid-inducible [Escherichia coli]